MQRLKDLNLNDIHRNQKYTFLFPIGATEQHGPFIPYGTDTYITDYIVDHLPQVNDDTIIVLPTLEYSKSQEHAGFAGTVWLKPATLKAVMRDICASLESIAEKIIFVSFHANDGVIRDFIRESHCNCDLFPLELCNEQDLEEIEQLLQGVADEHAGNTEISNIVAMRPDLVQIPPKDYPKHFVENPWQTDNLAEFCPDGIADNNPQWVANADIGQKILAIYVRRASESLKNILEHTSA